MVFNWPTITLGEVCKVQGGFIQTGPFGSQLHTSDYRRTGFPVVMPTNIGDGGIVTDGIARIGESDIARLAQHKLQLGDVVFSRRGDVTKNALIRTREVGWLCGTGCLKVRLGDESVATAKFISYCLRLPASKQWLIRHAVGATMPNLNTGILSAVPITLPPLGVQLEIVGILDVLDRRLALLREANATLEALVQSWFKSWFVDFDPVRAKMDGYAPLGMDEATAALFPASLDETEFGSVPKGWVMTSLANAFDINPQRPLKKGIRAPYLDMASLSTRGHCVEAPIEREMGSGSKFRNGDTLMARITPCLENGKSAFVDFLLDDQIGWGSTEFLVLRPKKPLPDYFAYLLCRHPPFREYAIQSMSGTSGRQRVQNDVLGRYMLAVPDENVAFAFTQIVETLRQGITANHKTSNTLRKLRDTLLPRLISGQLRTSETSDAIREAA
jgi:type I restriction enzyme S subunit